VPDDAPDWDTCTATEPTGADCIGIQVDARRRCLRHLKPEELTEVLGRSRPGQDVDVRGTTLSEDLLIKILTVVTDRDTRRPHLGTARFDRAQFTGAARFFNAQFNGRAAFYDAQFNGDAWFTDVEFNGQTAFGGARFSRDAKFAGTQFTSERLLLVPQLNEHKAQAD
jgi:hypothetical protein